MESNEKENQSNTTAVENALYCYGNKVLMQDSGTLKCMFTNMRSIMNGNKREELAGRMGEEKIDVLGVAESWTHAEIGDEEIEIVGYKVYRRDRKNGRGGGVLLYVREDLVSFETSDDLIQCESVWVAIQTKNGEINFGVCYRSPNAEVKEVDNLYSTIRRYSNKAAIIMGDFNYGDIDWKLERATGKAGDFIDIVHDCFLSQHVKDHTREDSILDLVLSTEPGLVEELRIESPVANSDHNVLIFTVPVTTAV